MGLHSIFGKILSFFKQNKEIRFNDMIDDIIKELLTTRSYEEAERKAKELGKKYSKATGLDIRVEVERTGATIWINDLSVSYEFIYIEPEDLNYIH